MEPNVELESVEQLEAEFKKLEAKFDNNQKKTDIHIDILMSLLGLDSVEIDILNHLKTIEEKKKEYKKELDKSVKDYIETFKDIEKQMQTLKTLVDEKVQKDIETQELLKECFSSYV